MEFFQDPTVIIAGLTLLGLVLVTFVYPYLGKLVTKTKTEVDDKLLEAFESIIDTKVSEKIEELKAKPKKKKTTKPKVTK